MLSLQWSSVGPRCSKGDGGGAAAHAGGGHCSSAQPIRTLSRGPQGLGWICG